MADETTNAPAGAQPDEFGKTFEFAHVFKAEVDLINRRRRDYGRATFELEREPARHFSAELILRPPLDANVVGLALSGGGIRSASFSLGALQALHRAKVFDGVDYLSTVSGGGYIGCALTAALEQSGRSGAAIFPFGSELQEDEPPALQHLRDYSNYLFPRGGKGNLLHNAAIYARGLVVNAVLIAPFLFGASAITLLLYALRDVIIRLFDPFGLQYFFVTLELFLILLLLGVAWGIFQSWPGRQQKTEIPGWPAVSVGTVIVAFLIVAFAELQPFILHAFMQANGNFITAAKQWISTISAILAPISAAFAYLSGKVGEYVKSAMQSPSPKDQTKGLVMKAALVVGGLVVPVLLWIAYLDLTYWGLCINTPRWGCMEPLWLDTVAYRHFAWLGYGQAATMLYLVIAVGCLVPSLFMQPNANSLHPLYRDRLGKAFIFKPWRLAPHPAEQDLVAEWRPRLSAISGHYGPYHLINTALNVEASRVANRRARNADFFIFSPQFVGSKSTDYVRTAEMEEVATSLNLPTAMAASGAAVSSEMGAETIKWLTATLALLNVRLGYWLRNPAKLHLAKRPGWRAGTTRIDRRNAWANYYFIAELFGLLSEKYKSVYLTDGGHIENLGIYELLRRRCAVIIAVDAEADPQMAFGSFNTLERYALIDMGIRIDLPWQPIANMSLVTGKALDDKGDAPKNHGPHCAIGQISYPDNRSGVLIYIKASLTGDENDTVIDYKKRYSDFPHETTIDQMFTEEQFEAYRALGFHAAFRLFDRSDRVARLDPAQNPTVWPAFDLLDRLFPRVDDGTPGPLTTFAATLPEPKTRRRPAVP